MFDFFRPVPKKRVVKIKSTRGVIYNNPSSGYKLVFHIANGFILLALVWSLYLYLPLVRVIVAYSVAKPIEITAPEPMVTGNEELSTEYSITIPKIMAYASVTKNVSPYDKSKYLSILKDGVVAQAKGSSDAGSGTGTTTFIFAHSTEQGWQAVRQNPVFYLLGQLENKDIVYINNKGTILTYQVYDQKIVKASDTHYLTYTEPDNEILILQTCWPIGTDWKRLLVFGKRV